MKVIKRDHRKSETGIKELVLHFVRQFVSSVVSFSLEFAVTVIFTEILGISYLISGVLGFFLGTLLLYLLSVHWIYNDHRYEDNRVELMLFFSLAGLAFLVNTVLLVFLVEVLGSNYIIAKPAAAAVIFFLNFLSKKFWLFRKKACSVELIQKTS
ncbi:MAG: GtrA family protein [Spirochaetales bacterium]|nr:GtrA family protein [Spirochaetales bacterium]